MSWAVRIENRTVLGWECLRCVSAVSGTQCVFMCEYVCLVTKKSEGRSKRRSCISCVGLFGQIFSLMLETHCVVLDSVYEGEGPTECLINEWSRVIGLPGRIF